MMKKTNRLAQAVERVLRQELKISANSASCGFAYQPKEPKGIEKFKTEKR